MKMGYLFWPVILICLGILLLLRAILPFNIPIFKIIIGLLLIWWGVQIIFGGTSWFRAPRFNWNSNRSPIVSANGTNTRYENIFSSNSYDLSDMTQGDVKVSNVFGQLRVRLPHDCIVYYSAAFGQIILPERQSIGFGNGEQRYGEGGPRIEIECVFGQVELTRNE